MTQYKSFEPGMKYWQIKHTGWFNPKFLNQIWSTNKLNIQGDCSICQYFMSGSKLGLNHPVCSICQYFISGSKLLDGITLYVQVVNTSCLVQNFWMESPCMFKLSVLHVLFKIFGWKHPILNQTWSTDKLSIQDDSIQHFLTRYEVDKLKIQGVSIQKFWTRHEE
jgi:hypothetical protein